METSARTGEGIKDAFESISREIIKDIEAKEQKKKQEEARVDPALTQSFGIKARDPAYENDKIQKDKKGCAC